MKTRFFRDSCVESVTGCRPLDPSCIRIYTPVLGSGVLLRSTAGTPDRCIHAGVRADSSERRIACSREKIAIF